MGIFDSLTGSNGLFGLGGSQGMMNPSIGLLGNNIDQGALRNYTLKNMLLGAGAGLLSQQPSTMPITFGSSLGAGLTQGLAQGQQAQQDYIKNAMLGQQMKVQNQQMQIAQQGADQSKALFPGQQKLQDLNVSQAQRDADNAAAFSKVVANIQDPTEKAFALRDPAGWSKMNIERKYGPTPVWGVTGHDGLGQETHGWISYPAGGVGAGAGASGTMQPSAGVDSAFSQPQQAPINYNAGVPGGQGVVSFGQGSTPPPILKPTQDQNGMSSIPANAMDLHGEEFLATLDPGIAGQVRAMVEGRIPYPTGMSARSPRMQAIAMYAQQTDPTLNAYTAPMRGQMLKDAMGDGKIGVSNNALNTSIGHLADLSDASQGLGNYSSGFGSSIQNSLRDSYQRFNQNPNYKTFDTVRNAVAGEVVKAYRGAGGAEADIQGQLGLISSANSPQELNNAIAETAKLLESKIAANQYQYETAMGPMGPKLKMIRSDAEAALQKFIDRAQGKAAPSNPALDAALAKYQ